jgi:Phospholipase_D-nuclease N-terminal/Short C-terminal domain
VLAYDYPLLGVFWTMFWFFLWFVWIMALFRVIFDIFRSHDMGGVSKAIWLIFVLLLPFLGVFVYLIARGSKMAQRDVAQAQANDEAFKEYVRQAATTSSGGSADELAKLADLKEKGVITDAEFAQQKAKILS